MPFRVRCPVCGEQIIPGWCAVVNTTTDPPTPIYDPPTGAERALRLLVPRSLGGKLTEQLPARKCYTPTCSFVFPYGVESARSPSIALIGGTSAGKSHYLAALIQTLERNGVSNAINCVRITPATSEMGQRFEDMYRRPLFKEREVLPETPAGTTPDPLIFQLVFTGTPDGKGFRGTVNLVFIDGSGEGQATVDALVKHSKYILDADAMIFLVDPMTLPVIAEETHMRYPKLEVKDAPAVDAWNNVAIAYERRHKLQPGSRLPLPVAVTLAKSDVLRYYDDDYVRQPPRFLQDPDYSRVFNRGDFEAVDNEVRGLLETHDNTTLLRGVNADTAFFAVSATRSAPDDSYHFPVVRPLRCADPLLWLLWRLGVVREQTS